jgi:hypothetical protein
MEFAADDRARALQPLIDALFQYVLYDEEPIFISDEATIWDVSLTDPDELLRRCSEYYQTSVSLDDFKKPLWRLLPELENRRDLSKA